MQIHHVVRLHVVINHLIHIIQVTRQVIVVDGHVMQDIIRMEVAVHHVLYDSGVVLELMYVMVVEIL